ncbi:large subunit rRNA processing RRM protein, putative [Plasmodium ovale curtisi]|uniref:Large subunit rRNA processing RRM protein, putative n=1 Tax=Plasmodium ovale curtisi TaxID=864141 RepID=A0A1A8VM62_PLAOA|nr:large subunit rRNA processing RRM protein, putative [Plasmodium ovale curtisi]
MKQSKIRKRPDSDQGNMPNEKSVKKEKKSKKRKAKKLKGILKGKTNDSNCRGSKTIVKRSRNGEDAIHMEKEKEKKVNTKYSEGNDINDVELGGNFEKDTEEETPREKKKKNKVKKDKEKKNNVKGDKEKKNNMKRDKEKKNNLKRDKEKKNNVKRDKEKKNNLKRDKEKKNNVKRDKEKKNNLKRDKGGIIHSIVDFLSKYEKESRPVGGIKQKNEGARSDVSPHAMHTRKEKAQRDAEQEKAAETEEEKEIKSQMTGEKRDKVLMYSEEDIKERKERTVFVGNVPIKNMNPTMLLKILNVQKSMVDAVWFRCIPLEEKYIHRKKLGVMLRKFTVSEGETEDGLCPHRIISNAKDNMNANITLKRKEDMKTLLDKNGTVYNGYVLRIRKHGEEDNFYRKKTVCIKNLDKSLNEKDLYFLFKEVDEIKGIRMLRDVRTYVSKDRKIIVEKVEDEKEAEKKGRSEKCAFVKRSEERKSMNRNVDRNVHRNGDRYIHRNGDRSVHRNGDRYIHRNGDRSVHRNGDRNGSRNGSRNGGRNGGRIFDKSNMKKKKYTRTKR